MFDFLRPTKIIYSEKNYGISACECHKGNYFSTALPNRFKAVLKSLEPSAIRKSFFLLESKLSDKANKKM